MALSQKCDTTSNYIGQIEMGRRIPSFEKIDKIAAALEIHSCELFKYEINEKNKMKKLNIKDYLQKLPKSIRKEIVANLLTTIKKDIGTLFDSR